MSVSPYPVTVLVCNSCALSLETARSRSCLTLCSVAVRCRRAQRTVVDVYRDSERKKTEYNLAEPESFALLATEEQGHLTRQSQPL